MMALARVCATPSSSRPVVLTSSTREGNGASSFSNSPASDATIAPTRAFSSAVHDKTLSIAKSRNSRSDTVRAVFNLSILSNGPMRKT